jgi:hypothetical protein
MSDRDDQLDAFLKKNAPRAPAPPSGEKQRIWREIERSSAPAAEAAWSWRELLALPSLRLALPALAVLVVVLGGLHARKARHDAEVDRVLSAALAYQLEDSGDSSIF